MLALQRMDDRVSITRDWFKNFKFTLVSSIEQLRNLTKICLTHPEGVSLDLETTGVDNRVYPDSYFNDGKVTRHGIRTIDRIAGVCMSFDGHHGYYIPLSHEPEDSGNLPWDLAWDELTKICYGCRIIFHNSKFDCEFLYPVTGKEFWKINEFDDTYLMSKVITPLKGSPNGLKPLTKINFGFEMVDIDELFTNERKEQLKREKKRYNFAMMHPKEGLEYGCSDGIFTYKLDPLLRSRLSEGDVKIYNLEKNFCNVMREMERNRVHIDVERVNQLYVECKAEIVTTGDQVREIIENASRRSGKWLTLNVGSPTQLSSALLTDQEGMRLKPTPKMLEAEAEGGFHDSDSSDDDDDDDNNPEGEEKKYSLKDEAIKSLQEVYGAKFPSPRGKEIKDPVTGKMRPETLFDLILEYRHYAKMLGSYVEKLVNAVDRNGDVRPFFNQMGTDTARLSCKAGKIEDGYSGVNFQGIPRDSDEDKPELFKQIRTCIAPRPGWMLVKLDYAGEELRVVTNLSGDPIWTKSFLYEDGDVHSITARTLFGKAEVNKDERNRGKRCNFAFIYGGGAGAIQRNIGCSIEDAQRHMQNLKNDVPVLMGYVDHQKKFAHQNKCIFTAFGRKLPIPTIDSPIRGIRSKAERCAINYTIQSTSADIIKFALCYVDKKLRDLGWKDRCRYVLTVHDEVVFEIKPECLQEIVRLLDEWMVLPWKLTKAHGRPWVVPLLTEPGIDIHWKARYNYFEMVDGVAVKPELIDEEGKYTGKLKKEQVFADGRIYQKIPDFLEAHIKRAPIVKALPVPEGTQEAAPLPSGEAPAQPELPPAIEAPKALPEAPDPGLKEIATATPPEPVLIPAPAPVEVPAQTAPPTLNLSMETSMGVNLNDISLDMDVGDLGADIPTTKSTPPPAPEPAKAALAPTITPAPAPAKLNGKHDANGPIRLDGDVFRWTMRGVLTEYNLRKLHALCLLAEGNTPLRIIGLNGDVLIGDEAGVRVNPEEFRFAAKMFGLG